MNRRGFMQLLGGASLISQSHWLLADAGEKSTEGGYTEEKEQKEEKGLKAKSSALMAAFAQLEANHSGRLGVAALDTASGSQIEYRGSERFPLCSTFKFMAAAAMLKRSETQPELLAKQIHYRQQDLVSYSPITEKNQDSGMTLAELCQAALQYSDNTAGNLLLNELGGPAALTQFARSLGDTDFQLERWETELNTAIPGDKRDTSSPMAMLRSMNRLLLGQGLKPAQQQQLIEWLKGNTTGNKRIRAGLPSGWQAGDKTGSGDYGTSNDIAIIFPPQQQPLLLCIYFTQPEPKAQWNNQVIVETTQRVLKEFALL